MILPCASLFRSRELNICIFPDAEMEPDAETTEGLSLGSTEAVGAQMRGGKWLVNIGMTEEVDS